MPASSPRPIARRLRSPWLVWALIFAVTGAAFSYAQRGRRGQREELPRSVPQWEVDDNFQHDVFSFARLRYDSWSGGGGWGGRRGGGWATDAPEADLNLMFRLQQMTSLKVNPEPTYIDIEAEQLRHYPFVYMVEPGRLTFRDAQVVALRDHLLNGGFLMVDDFWGNEQWQNFRYEIERVFPDLPLVELEIDHPIFHSVFDLDIKPQIPSINSFMYDGSTSERNSGPVHYWAIFDAKGRMMAFIGHNTDLGDGWEREGEDPTYFERFSERYAYPLAINIIYYAMTH